MANIPNSRNGGVKHHEPQYHNPAPIIFPMPTNRF